MERDVFDAFFKARDLRERRDGLLRRLLQADVERYYSAILQCVRYIVKTDFLRSERPVREDEPMGLVPVKMEADELDSEATKELDEEIERLRSE